MSIDVGGRGWVWMFTQSWIAAPCVRSVGAAGRHRHVRSHHWACNRRRGGRWTAAACGGRMALSRAARRRRCRRRGPVSRVDGTARGRRVRDEVRRSAREGLLDVEWIDDAVGAADGERGGVDVLLRGGGPAAGGVGGGNSTGRSGSSARCGRSGAEAEARRATAASGRSRGRRCRRSTVGRSVATVRRSRKMLKEAQIPAARWTGRGVSALPLETAGRIGKDGGRGRTRGRRRCAARIVRIGGDGGLRTVDGSGRPRCTQTRLRGERERGERRRRRLAAGARLLRELAALGCTAPEDVGVCLGDGDEWTAGRDWFPNAVRIVDFFHAAEYRGRRRAPATAATWTKACATPGRCRLLCVYDLGRQCQFNVATPASTSGV